MKKHLLTSTALVAAGVVAAAGAAQAQKGKKPFITINGYHEQVIGFTADQDDAAVGDKALFDNHTETEIHFNGHASLDNGIKLRAHWELDGNLVSQGSDVLDEVYLVIRGSFGQLTLGSEDNAGHLMTIGYAGSWATGVGQNLTFDSGDWITVPPGFNRDFDSTVNDIRLRSGENDSEKVSYYTPRFGGFQLGVSYIPNFEQDMNGSVAAVSGTYHDGWAVGVNFNRKMDKFGLGVAAGYLQAEAPEGINVPDPSAYILAGRLDFGPFRVSGAVKKNKDFRDFNTLVVTAGGLKGNNAIGTATSNSGTVWDIGARYSWGPNRVSVTYSHGEGEATIANPDDDTVDHGMLSFARQLAPGVKWSANVIFADWQGEDVGTKDDNSGWAVTTALRMNF